MVFRVDYKSGKPVYLQLVDQVRYAAASGALRPGDPLPSIRPLSEELRVNRNTVAKAYTELESRGIIETVAGRGCFLKGSDSPLSEQVRQAAIVAKIDEAIVSAHQMQVEPQRLREILAERLEFFSRKATKNISPEPDRKEKSWTPISPSSTSPISTGALESWTPSTD
jgi:GntR family transcriptional regulator